MGDKDSFQFGDERVELLETIREIVAREVERRLNEYEQSLLHLGKKSEEK